MLVRIEPLKSFIAARSLLRFYRHDNYSDAAGFPYPPPVKRMSFGEEKIDYYKPARPALKGVKTPPFDEAMAYFKQVLASVRPLPQLHGPAPGNSPTVPASAASR